jgi:hypothetical protein
LKKSSASVKLLHFDSHADLSIPFIHNSESRNSCALWKESASLYEILEESDGGIAEFLIPLLYNGHVDEVAIGFL